MSSIHVADFFPLPHIESVKLKAAVPFVVRHSRKMRYFRELIGMDPSNPMESQIKKIPCARLSVILEHAKALAKLDLSEMWVGDDDAAVFRYSNPGGLS